MGDHAFLTVRDGVAPSLAEVEARREKNPRVTFLSRGIWQNTETVFIVTQRDVHRGKGGSSSPVMIILIVELDAIQNHHGNTSGCIYEGVFRKDW